MRIGEFQSPLPTTAFCTSIKHVTETLHSSLSQRHPWLKLVDCSRFSKVESVTDVATRIQKNYAYFRVNYLTVVAAAVGFSLLANHLYLIILIGLLAVWLFERETFGVLVLATISRFLHLFRPSDPTLVVLDRTISDRETLNILIVRSIVVIFLTNVGSILISVLLAGNTIVCFHGAFRKPTYLFLDEQEASASTRFSHSSMKVDINDPTFV
ncbi:hypothetical protein L6452_05005 [Arctium lappa]|uniref:Uncharacterized protein n=1 Tax=Arctium lappa TaxID=4217 RepID=A0ACB9EFW2_ARCLA|nr:hypothetical protein L6452_05005 [Arctium lappa]